MKDSIIKLRKLGLSYNEIKEKLGCSKSTISYHCNKENISDPVRTKKISNDIIKCINSNIKLTNKQISEKYNISISTVKKYKKNKRTKNKKIKNNKKCLNCGSILNRNNKFCSLNCSSEHKHYESYKNFLLNNDDYCRPNYSPKSFKDIFLKEQEFKCDICKMENKWEDKELIFVMDHIDGDASNNKRDNIRLICPNCDSQTITFKSRNKNSTRRNYWKEKIIREIS